MADTPLLVKRRTIWLDISAERLVEAMRAGALAARAAAASVNAVDRMLRDLADPPSRERRELRLIARAERAEARVWWEQHRQNTTPKEPA